MSWKTINYTKLGGQHAFEKDFLNSRTLRRFLPEVAEQQMFTQQGRAPLKNARDESAQFKVNSPQGRPQVGSQGGRRFKHPTAVKQWAHAAAGGEEEGRHQPVCYLHKHTHTHTPTPSFLGAGRAGAALTQEVRKPGGQRSHNFEPFKPSRPRQPLDWQQLSFPPFPQPSGGAPGLTSSAPWRRRAPYKHLPLIPSPPAGTAPKRLCAAPTNVPSVRGYPRPPPYQESGSLAGGSALLTQHGGCGTPRRALKGAHTAAAAAGRSPQAGLGGRVSSRARRSAPARGRSGGSRDGGVVRIT